MRKYIRYTQTKGHSAKYLPSTPEDCQGHKNQGKNVKLRLKTNRLNARWRLGMDPGTEKGR